MKPTLPGLVLSLTVVFFLHLLPLEGKSLEGSSERLLRELEIESRFSYECPPDDFECPNFIRYRCIGYLAVCDGDNDCGDNADEEESLCATRTCKPDQFKCNNGKCIGKSWTCNTQDNCGDNSDEDEHMCKLCKEDQFTCKSDQYDCVYWDDVCDVFGIHHCEDGSDESDETCQNFTCPGEKFKCDNGKCINRFWRCNLKTECKDGSDEKNCANTTCAPDEFRCNSGMCIPAYWPCNGRSQCPGGDDEDEELCSTYDCGPKGFKCANNRCIFYLDVCNGRDNCRDGSDELDCPP